MGKPSDEEQLALFLKTLETTERTIQKFAFMYVKAFFMSIFPQDRKKDDKRNPVHRLDSKQIRDLLSCFVEDIFTLLYLPEWPAAEYILVAIWTELIAKVKEIMPRQDQRSAAKNPTFSHFLCIEFLGNVCAEVEWHSILAKKYSLVLRDRQIEVNKDATPNDKGEIVDCVCGSNTEDLNKSYIACDDCEVWFHSECVGIFMDVERYSKEHGVWYCPPCVFRQEIENQRKQHQANTPETSSDVVEAEVVLQLCLNYYSNPSKTDSQMKSSRQVLSIFFFLRTVQSSECLPFPNPPSC